MGQRYVIREAKTKEELDEIIKVIWAANYTPYEPFMQLFFPVLGYTTAHREAAIAESKQRIWTRHQKDCWLFAMGNFDIQPICRRHTKVDRALVARRRTSEVL